jgi:hypothetical protein
MLFVMPFQRGSHGAVVTILGLLVGCSGGSGTPTVGGRSGTAGTTGAGSGGSDVGGATGAGGTTGVIGTGDGGAAGSADGGSTSSGGAGGTAGSSAAGGAAGVVGGGGTAVGGSAAGGGAAGSGAVKKSGYVYVMQDQPTAAPATAQTLAFFSVDNSNTDTSTCPPTTAEECKLSCSPGATFPTNHYAGAVSISGLLSPVTLNWSPFSAPNNYASSYAAPLWTTSTPATLTVTGSDAVPAFTMGLTFPNPISITAPVATIGYRPDSKSYAISKTGALNIAWTGGVDGQVMVSIYSDSIRIVCAVDAAKGAVTVPANLMALLGATGTFSAIGANHADRTVGDWSMHFLAWSIRDEGTATFSN